MGGDCKGWADDLAERERLEVIRSNEGRRRKWMEERQPHLIRNVDKRLMRAKGGCLSWMEASRSDFIWSVVKNLVKVQDTARPAASRHHHAEG